MFELAGEAFTFKLDFHHFFRWTEGITWFTMEAPIAVPPAGGDVDHGPAYRMTRSDHRMTIFYRCRSAMVEGKMTRGIFKELAGELGFSP